MRALQTCVAPCAPAPTPASSAPGPAPQLAPSPLATEAGAGGGAGSSLDEPPVTYQSGPTLPGSFTALLSVGLLAVVGLVFLASIVGAFTVWLRAMGGGEVDGARGETSEREGRGEGGADEGGEGQAQRRLVYRPVPSGLDPALLAYLPSYIFHPPSAAAEPAVAPPANGRGAPGVAGVELDCQQPHDYSEGEEVARKGPETWQEGAAGKSHLGAEGGGGCRECPVCLCEYEAGDVVAWLPGCAHAFHGPCIEAWLGSHSTCPLCRVSVKSELENLAAAAHPGQPAVHPESLFPVQPQSQSPSHSQSQPPSRSQPQSQSESDSQSQPLPQSRPLSPTHLQAHAEGEGAPVRQFHQAEATGLPARESAAQRAQAAVDAFLLR